MARVILTPAAVPAAYADAGAALTWTAADTGDKNRTLFTGAETILARNTNGGSTVRTATLTSIADSQRRTNDVVVSIPAGGFAVLPKVYPHQSEGWLQADGYLWFEGSHAELQFAVLRDPR